MDAGLGRAHRAPGESIPIVETRVLILREIPAFRSYWFRVLARDVVRGGRGGGSRPKI